MRAVADASQTRIPGKRWVPSGGRMEGFQETGCWIIGGATRERRPATQHARRAAQEVARSDVGSQCWHTEYSVRWSTAWRRDGDGNTPYTGMYSVPMFLLLSLIRELLWNGTRGWTLGSLSLVLDFDVACCVNEDSLQTAGLHQSTAILQEGLWFDVDVVDGPSYHVRFHIFRLRLYCVRCK